MAAAASEKSRQCRRPSKLTAKCFWELFGGATRAWVYSNLKVSGRISEREICGNPYIGGEDQRMLPGSRQLSGDKAIHSAQLMGRRLRTAADFVKGSSSVSKMASVVSPITMLNCPRPASNVGVNPADQDAGLRQTAASQLSSAHRTEGKDNLPTQLI